MLRGVLLCLALAMWSATLQKYAGAADLMQIMYHVSEEPSGVFWNPSEREEMHAFSALHCATLTMLKDGAGYTYQDGWCIVEGGNASFGISFVGAQFFYNWNINRAFKRPVLGVSYTYSGSPASHAVDEVACFSWSTTYTDCCYVTYSRNNTWLVIDLEATLKVFVVIVQAKFLGVSEVRVGSELKTDDFSTYELLGQTKGTTSRAAYLKFSKREGITGRYVSFQQLEKSNMYVCDVIVMADD